MSVKITAFCHVIPCFLIFTDASGNLLLIFSAQEISSHSSPFIRHFGIKLVKHTLHSRLHTQNFCNIANYLSPLTFLLRHVRILTEPLWLINRKTVV
jgi:hypothetical protein